MASDNNVLMSSGLTIIGIDPGSRIAGFGVVTSTDGNIKYREHGVLRLSHEAPLETRLKELSQKLKDVLARHAPQVAVIERVFLGKNADSAFKLGHARGVCMLELSSCGAKIIEYAAKEVKKGVTGSGSSSKEQVEILVSASLKLPRSHGIPADATDALALAYYHAVNLQVEERFARQRAGRKNGREVEL